MLCPNGRCTVCGSGGAVDRVNAVFRRGVRGLDGCTYDIPCNANKILKYGPDNEINVPSEDYYDKTRPKNPSLVGDEVGKSDWNSTGGVVAHRIGSYMVVLTATRTSSSTTSWITRPCPSGFEEELRWRRTGPKGREYLWYPAQLHCLPSELVASLTPL